MNLLPKLSITARNQLSPLHKTVLLLLAMLLFFGMATIAASSPHPNCYKYEEIASKADTSEPKVEEVFKVVEEMPRFPGCEEQDLSDYEKRQCAQRKLLEFIYEEITYPEEARKNEVSGMVVVQFIVEKDGSVSNVQAVRDVGSGCGAEAVRVVELMNERGIQWIPGKHHGENVRVQFNLPVSFKLNDEKSKSKPDFEKIDREKQDPNYVFKEVETPPFIKECANKNSSPRERQECTKEAIVKAKKKYNDFLQSPRKDDLKGITVVEFIIEKDGSTSNEKIVRPLCEECDTEALRQVRLMNKNDLNWIPGKIDGKPVRISYLIAIPFEK
jgi:TonB family protein